MTSVRRFKLSELLYACRRHDRCPLAHVGDFGTSRPKGSSRSMYSEYNSKWKTRNRPFYPDCELKFTSRKKEAPTPVATEASQLPALRRKPAIES